ncbi:MAG: GNAT family N-acetyltransferase [Proteobacteria bacterium]|nr:GNAT family N-acetyltransferase [Pseudomonadota bacterium]HQR03280.1 GNAT family N-acetyltransferase [Rhodocyclaceae bacterium]
MDTAGIATQEVALRTAGAADLDRIMVLEAAGFDPAHQEDRAVYTRRIAAFPAGALLACDGNNPWACLFAELWEEDPAAGVNAEWFALGHDIYDRHRPGGRTLYIASMTVAPFSRGGGAGGRFFAACVDHLLRAHPSVERVLLLVNENWQPARRIYESQGFAGIARLPGFFRPDSGVPEDGIVMMRPRAG